MNKSDSAINLSTSTEFISLKLYEKLITELRCPGCAMPMKYPILMCEIGHSICEDCTEILESCPLCKEKFTSIRNLTLEALCSKAEFPCENSINGCRLRCTTSLLEWHEKICTYRIVKCFIGKVWGKCEWKGCEKDWLKHINEIHLDKVFTITPIELNFNIKNDLKKQLNAYYIFQIYDHVFSFYQIYDKINRRILWTVSYEPKKNDKKDMKKLIKFSFEIEVYDKKNPLLKGISQKYECHHNGDKGILKDGACAVISMGDALRFIDENKVLHYRIHIHKINENIKPEKPIIKSEKQIPIDFQQTSIEGVNHKQVPSNLIITRKIDKIQSNKTNNKNNDNNDDCIVRLSSSESDFEESDLELEAFVNNLFRKKFLLSNSTDCISDDDNFNQKQKISLSSKSTVNLIKNRKQHIFESFTRSCRGIKTSFTEFKTLHKRGNSKNDEMKNSLELC